eukprot:CAMPEP_0194436042 /NCGR_PEP_ID=MMETSP0176-20130528/92378_1 /TAXON_ID=216777 /ORGANISM="Proboscia alata, Strain PI-D3" /LENGTH=51 /DNA_ID=CAMNT_0039255975 /DNA_START=198 /DNA_END=353 /DNA_ORIENTATION=-
MSLACEENTLRNHQSSSSRLDEAKALRKDLVGLPSSDGNPALEVWKGRAGI